MTDEEELALVVQKVIDQNPDAKEISPAWVATAAMADIAFPRSLHRLGYAGCHLELRQIARSKLRRQFDPTAAAASTPIDDFFPETLQDRYPRQPRPNEEPTYILLGFLNDEDLAYNVSRMRRAGNALLKHADALEAYGDNRPSGTGENEEA